MSHPDEPPTSTIAATPRRTRHPPNPPDPHIAERTGGLPGPRDRPCRRRAGPALAAAFRRSGPASPIYRSARPPAAVGCGSDGGRNSGLVRRHHAHHPGCGTHAPDPPHTSRRARIRHQRGQTRRRAGRGPRQPPACGQLRQIPARQLLKHRPRRGNHRDSRPRRQLPADPSSAPASPWSQFWSHSPQSAAVHRRPRPLVRAGHGRWRTVVNGGAQYSKACEGATPPWVQIPPPPPLTCKNTGSWQPPGRCLSTPWLIYLAQL